MKNGREGKKDIRKTGTPYIKTRTEKSSPNKQVTDTILQVLFAFSFIYIR